MICDDNLERCEKVFLNDASCRQVLSATNRGPHAQELLWGAASWGRSAHLAQSQQTPAPTVVTVEVGGEQIPVCVTRSSFVMVGEGIKCQITISAVVNSREVHTYPQTNETSNVRCQGKPSELGVRDLQKP